MQVFFAGGLGSPIRQKIDQSPICHESPFLDESLSPSLPAEIFPPPLFFLKNTVLHHVWQHLGLKTMSESYFMLKTPKMGKFLS